MAYFPTLDPVQSAAATAIPIRTTDTAQTIVDAQPPGTTFVIKTGTHPGFALNLANTNYNGMRFIGEPGAVLDGGGASLYCVGGFARDVLFRGWSDSLKMAVQNYQPGWSGGTVVACCSNQDVTSSLPGWEVAYLALTNNGNFNVRGGASSNIHDITITNAGINPLAGAGYGSPLRPCIVKNVVINNYNTSDTDPGIDGGCKFTNARYVNISNVTIVGNSNHAAAHNSFGLWFDVDCEHIVVHDCNISHIPCMGLFAEISGNVQFYNNTISNCGFAFDGVGTGFGVPTSRTWGFGRGAGILIASSGHGPHSDGADIFANTITSCGEGIVVLEQARGLFSNDWLTHHYSQDVRVFRNALSACGGSGVLTDIGAWSSGTTYAKYAQVYSGGRMFASFQNSNLNHTPPGSATSDSWWEYVADDPWNLTTRRLRWNQNTYTGSCGATAQPQSPGAFYWNTINNTAFSGWQTAGQDANSSYS